MIAFDVLTDVVFFAWLVFSLYECVMHSAFSSLLDSHMRFSPAVVGFVGSVDDILLSSWDVFSLSWRTATLSRTRPSLKYTRQRKGFAPSKKGDGRLDVSDPERAELKCGVRIEGKYCEATVH